MTHVTTDDEEEPLARLAYVLGVEPAILITGSELHDRWAPLLIMHAILQGGCATPQADWSLPIV